MRTLRAEIAPEPLPALPFRDLLMHQAGHKNTTRVAVTTKAFRPYYSRLDLSRLVHDRGGRGHDNAAQAS